MFTYKSAQRGFAILPLIGLLAILTLAAIALQSFGPHAPPASQAASDQTNNQALVVARSQTAGAAGDAYDVIINSPALYPVTVPLKIGANVLGVEGGSKEQCKRGSIQKVSSKTKDLKVSAKDEPIQCWERASSALTALTSEWKRDTYGYYRKAANAPEQCTKDGGAKPDKCRIYTCFDKAMLKDKTGDGCKLLGDFDPDKVQGILGCEKLDKTCIKAMSDNKIDPKPLQQQLGTLDLNKIDMGALPEAQQSEINKAFQQDKNAQDAQILARATGGDNAEKQIKAFAKKDCNSAADNDCLAQIDPQVAAKAGLECKNANVDTVGSCYVPAGDALRQIQENKKLADQVRLSNPSLGTPECDKTGCFAYPTSPKQIADLTAQDYNCQEGAGGVQFCFRDPTQTPPPGTKCADNTDPPCKPGNEPPGGGQCKSGETKKEGCNSCSCMNGTWACTLIGCGPGSSTFPPQQNPQQQPPPQQQHPPGGNQNSPLQNLMKALGFGQQQPPPPPQQQPQQCPTDPQQYAQWQQQYQQQLQQYNYQMQQYQYQQQLNQYYAQQQGGYPQQQQLTPPPMQPQPCTPSTGNQCQLQLQQTPPAANCNIGTWKPIFASNGVCVTNWQCVPGSNSSNFSANPTSGPAPLTVTFTGTVPVPSTIDFGDGTNFVGTGCGAAACPPANLTKTHTYTSIGIYQAQLTSNGNAISTVTITVASSTATSTPPTTPLRAELSCQPQVADVGMTVAFAFSCSAGTSKGSGFDTGGAQSGSATATVGAPPPGANTATYALTCTDSGRTAGAQCSVQVNRPSIILVANPKTVQSGSTSLLGWVTTGMQSCIISSPDQDDFTAANASYTSVNGTALTAPITGPTRFLLHCQTIAGGTKEAAVTINAQ